MRVYLYLFKSSLGRGIAERSSVKARSPISPQRKIKNKRNNKKILGKSTQA